MNTFPLSTQVSEIFEPLHWDEEKKSLMVGACREMAHFHQKNCPEIFALYKKYNFDPNSIETEKDLERIPFVGVTAMKHNLLTSMDPKEAVLKLTSSGTRGQKTQIWMDQLSLDRVQRMMDVYWEQENFTSQKLTNYLVFNYDPDDAKDLGIAFTDKNQLRFAPVADVFYAIKKDKMGQWQFLKEMAYEKLKEYAQDSKPVRIFGMPGFIYEFLKSIEKYDPMKLPPESVVFTGGGWKAAEDKQISREEFRNKLCQKLGIPLEWIRDAYGMAEHCAPYFECSHHQFHIPVYNRILIRSPFDLKVLKRGEVGLMELITPFNTMMPNLAILSTDLGKINEHECPCGFRSPTFTLVGRAGLKKHKGCALTANDIVRRSQNV